VSVGLALDEEKVDNGALWFAPGSRMAFDADRFDAAKFFRAERAEMPRSPVEMHRPII
jgi:phytanoyl-CoA hydroxylase